MARIRFYPHNMGSQGCSRLRDELRNRGHNVFKVRGTGAYRPRSRDLIISWGNGTARGWELLNKPSPVTTAQNKLDTFRMLYQAGISIPEFTTDRGQAQAWLNDGVTVLSRHALNTSGGRGIVVLDPAAGDAADSAPMYVKYIKKMNEYRVHVFNGQVIDITEKKRRRDFDGQRDTHIRNVANGYVFVREDVRPHASVGPLAISAVQALGLDFGAVDIIWNSRRQQAYVLEINTAPGVEGTTVERYANAIEEYIGTRTTSAPIRRQAATRTVQPAPRPRFENDRNADNTDF